MAKRNKWWYLLPVAFPITGGLIGYLIHAGIDKKFARRLLFTGITVAISLFAFIVIMTYFAIQYFILLYAGVI